MNRSLDGLGELAGHDVVLSRLAARDGASHKPDHLATPLPAWMRAVGRLIRAIRGGLAGASSPT